MSKVIITVTTGSEIHAGAQCKLHAFYVQSDKKEVFLSKAFTAMENKDRIQMVGTPSNDNSVEGVRSEIGGYWQSLTLEAEEGTLLKVFASRRPTWSTPMRQGSFYFRPRADAALRRITMDTLQIAGKSRRNSITLTGRFDILKPYEAIREYGITIVPAFERFFLESSLENLFKFEVSEPERARREVIEQKEIKHDDGTGTIVRTRRRERSLEI